ncbi:MAG: hypothetical protein ABJF10_13575 [Chthoniobacter sp.]|uniref:hypothetical protein n=1 Tax=Chthoniobacter sp. TaxID=2510640 RepID=UPI0032AD4CD2
MNETKASQDETREAPLPEIRTMFGDADEAAIQDIEKRYGELIPPDRLAEMRAHPTVFETDEEFRTHFDERFGEQPKEGTLGWATEPSEAPHVSTAEVSSVPEIVYHERLHQAADREAAQATGSAWHEGLTQALTERATGISHEGDAIAPYPEGTARVKSVAEVAGWDALEKLYFAGDKTGLSSEAVEQKATE